MITSPQATAIVSATNAQNGSSRACGCQMSISSSLPIDHVSAATSSSIQRSVRQPPTRAPTSAVPSAAAALIVPTPIAVAVPMPNARPNVHMNGASRSGYSGPGLLTSMPSANEADVHDPSNGLCDVPTSSARIASSAASPIGNQPCTSARTTATTIGSNTAARAAQRQTVDGSVSALEAIAAIPPSSHAVRLRGSSRS